MCVYYTYKVMLLLRVCLVYLWGTSIYSLQYLFVIKFLSIFYHQDNGPTFFFFVKLILLKKLGTSWHVEVKIGDPKIGGN